MAKTNNNEFIEKGCSYFILFILLAAIGYIILDDADWIMGDDSQFLFSTMLGKPSHSWVGQGRFWPLGLFDYSILILLQGFGQTTVAHFLYNVVVMTISVFVLFRLLYLISKNYLISLFCTILLFCSTSFLQLHMNCIYPERFMFFLQVLFMYFWLRGRIFQSTMSYIIAWFCATYLIFSKEPVFGMILVIALTNLIFSWKSLRRKEKNFHFACGIVAVLFIWLYAYIFLGIFSSFNLYGGGHLIFFPEIDAWKIITSLVFKEVLLIPMYGLAVVRAYWVLVKSDRENLFLDSLLFGASAYTTAYIIMTMTSSTYYIFPSLVFALPSFAYWLTWLWKKSTAQLVFAVLILIISVGPSICISNTYTQLCKCYRRTDMPMLNELVKESLRDRKPIYVYMDGVPLNHYISNRGYMDTCGFHSWKGGVEYVLRNKIKEEGSILNSKIKTLVSTEGFNADDKEISDFFKTMNIFRFVEHLEDIPDNSNVLCPSKSSSKYKCLHRKFPISHEQLGMEMYCKIKID